jgi:hypothetical protein
LEEENYKKKDKEVLEIKEEEKTFFGTLYYVQHVSTFLKQIFIHIPTDWCISLLLNGALTNHLMSQNEILCHFLKN